MADTTGPVGLRIPTDEMARILQLGERMGEHAGGAKLNRTDVLLAIIRRGLREMEPEFARKQAKSKKR